MMKFLFIFFIFFNLMNQMNGDFTISTNQIYKNESFQSVDHINVNEFQLDSKSNSINEKNNYLHLNNISQSSMGKIHPDQILKDMIQHIFEKKSWYKLFRRYVFSTIFKQAFSTCNQLSVQCKNDLVNFDKQTELMIAYDLFSIKAIRYYHDFIYQNCWEIHEDGSYGHKPKQGKCFIDYDFSDSMEMLENVCSNANGKINNATSQFGMGGVYFQIILPTCVPNSCNQNFKNLKIINKCLSNVTCQKIPAVLLTTCQINMTSYSKADTLLIMIYILFSCIMGIAVLLLLIYNFRFIPTSPKKMTHNNTNETQSSGLHENLLNKDENYDDVTLSSTKISRLNRSISSDLSDSSFNMSGGFGHFVVPGTPCILNLKNSEKQSSNTNSPFEFNYNENDHMNVLNDMSKQINTKERNNVPTENPPRFKISSQFERHILQTFKFRSEELCNDSDFAGWGAGSSSASSLVWRSIFYKKNGVNVLNGLSGYIKPGMCVACIGAADSGATTLLKTLAGRIKNPSSTNQIMLDGRPPNGNLEKVIAYISKEDVHSPNLTVRETFEFSLNLRSPSNMPHKIRMNRIQVILSLLNLNHVADSFIGDQVVRGISGGEKRRVSFGVELVIGRSLLIASQPTNGLDSSAAYEVVKVMRALSNTGLAAFLVTISQSSSELLELFDTLYLISRGNCIYFGPTNRAESFFTSLGFSCPSYKSFPDFLEELTGDANQFQSDVNDEIILNEDDDLKFYRRSSLARKNLVDSFLDSDL